MTISTIDKIRFEVADTDSTFPILTDEVYTYLIEKHNSSVARASIDAARIILMHLSQRSDETVDIFSVKGSKAAESYRMALMLYLKDPYTNPILQNVQGWFGGVSNSDIQKKLLDTDNNTVTIGQEPRVVKANYFSA